MSDVKGRGRVLFRCRAGSGAESKLKLIRRAGGRNSTPRARSLHLSFIMRAICCSSPRSLQPFYVLLFFLPSDVHNIFYDILWHQFVVFVGIWTVFVSAVTGESSVYSAMLHENAECIFHYTTYQTDNGSISQLYDAVFYRFVSNIFSKWVRIYSLFDT